MQPYFRLKEMVPLGAIKLPATQATILETGVQNRMGTDPADEFFYEFFIAMRGRNAVLPSHSRFRRESLPAIARGSSKGRIFIVFDVCHTASILVVMFKGR